VEPLATWYTIWRFSELQDKIADKKPFEFTSRNTIGSYGLFTISLLLVEQTKKFSYYSLYKQGNGFRPNSILKAKIILPI
jgi:Fe(3+) dicitrate transport protein